MIMNTKSKKNKKMKSETRKGSLKAQNLVQWNALLMISSKMEGLG